MATKPKRKKKKELIAEDAWLIGLPTIPRVFLGMLKYSLKELLIFLVFLFAGLWLLTSFGYIGSNVKITPGVKIEYKTDKDPLKAR